MTQPDFLGRGWAFPVAPDASGEAALVDGSDDVRQAILIILQTEPGERVMRPDFGAGLRGLVFEPINTSTLARVKHCVEQALISWEPRIILDLVNVTVPGTEMSRLDIEVRYRIRATNTFDNLVYPFYLQEGAT
jgi:phage baseplate assembly protein W